MEEWYIVELVKLWNQRREVDIKNYDYEIEKDIPLTSSKGTSKLQNYAITLSQNECDLQRTTEALRHKLVQLFFKEGSFSSPAVLEISQQLDECIVAVQKIRLTK